MRTAGPQDATDWTAARRIPASVLTYAPLHMILESIFNCPLQADFTLVIGRTQRDHMRKESQ
ncbi:MAG TPA: hypothetical protein VJ258_03230 [Candidatus Limnocylindrales bacterium]|nr:hypothetical protein [Candidatus Limnocylindrales bacterium]